MERTRVARYVFVIQKPQQSWVSPYGVSAQNGRLMAGGTHMARPKKADDERRTFPVAFRCTASEMERLAKGAERTRQSVPVYARQASLASQVRVVQEQRLDFETRQELRAIGNNLNQIARALNSDRPFKPDELDSALIRLHEFFDDALPS